ncbi:MAG: hypothetical protein PHE59_05020 [Patescibacteria group bacterium]|nr:hypothetical protein [Patescibacteria group bacterium]MDD5164814.1 hypothetical protein [Patescibacteria group bacterium]MDD5534445.1 hypothetical protein [Patescibacteria group bacterium]
MIKKNSKKFRIKHFLLFFIFIILVLLAIILLAKNAQAPGFFYNTEPQPETKSNPEPVKGTNSEPVEGAKNSLSEYSSATFSDSFSGQAWLDTTRTNLYFDWTSQNLIFPPVLDTEEVSAGDFLINFIPEKISSEGDFALFVGTHRISQKKQLLIWQIKENHWSKFDVSTLLNINPESAERVDFSTLGLSDTASILGLEKITSSSNWLLFSQDPSTNTSAVSSVPNGSGQANNLKIDILKITDSETDHPRIELIAEKSWPISSFKDIQIECGEKNCLIAISEPLTIFKVDTNGSLTTLENLTKSLKENNPDQVVISKGLSAENWLVVLSKKIPRQSASSPSESAPLYQYEINEIKNETLNNKGITFTAEYPGRPSLLILKNKNIFLFWGSYFTQAYEITPQNKLIDLSGDFGWRISANKPFHLYQLSHSIYIKNEDRSIIRWGGGTNVRIDPKFWFTFNPDFLKIIPYPQNQDSGYLIAGVPSGGTKIYQFNDLGFDLSKPRQIVSAKINFSVTEIKAAQITNLQGKIDSAQTEYWLSNDGGKNWEKAEIGKPVIFKTVGNDLRYKIILTPNSNDSYTVPVLNSIYLWYWYK